MLRLPGFQTIVSELPGAAATRLEQWFCRALQSGPAVGYGIIRVRSPELYFTLFQLSKLSLSYGMELSGVLLKRIADRKIEANIQHTTLNVLEFQMCCLHYDCSRVSFRASF